MIHFVESGYCKLAEKAILLSPVLHLDRLTQGSDHIFHTKVFDITNLSHLLPQTEIHTCTLEVFSAL